MVMVFACTCATNIRCYFPVVVAVVHCRSFSIQCVFVQDNAALSYTHSFVCACVRVPLGANIPAVQRLIALSKHKCLSWWWSLAFYLSLLYGEGGGCAEDADVDLFELMMMFLVVEHIYSGIGPYR